MVNRLWFALAVLSGCGAQTVADVKDDAETHVETRKTENGPLTFLVSRGETEKIIGTDEKVVVSATGDNIPARYRPLLDAFGKIAMGCTATHIGGGLVLTAGHCFSAPETPVVNQPCSDTVEWGNRKDAVVYLTSTCTKILAMEYSTHRDYAIFQVSPVPTAFIPVDLSARPANGRSISIFGHPQLRPLEWSPAGNLSKPPCTVIASEFADGGFRGAEKFNHQCDTEPGNSGSTVIDDVTLKVVGIHNGGISPWNYSTYLTGTPLASILSGDGGVVVIPDAGSPAGDAGTPRPDAGTTVATPLSNGVAMSGLAGAKDSQAFFSMWIPAGTSALTVRLAGGSGDADMYVRSAQLPTTSAYQCRPFASSSNENCSFNNPTAGWWYVMVRGYSAYSGASLTATWNTGMGADGGTDGGVSPTDAGVGQVLVRGVPVGPLAAAAGSRDVWSVELPAGVTRLTVSTSSGSGDVDVYARLGQAPTTVTYACASRSSTTRETCTVQNPGAGTWFVLLQGYTTYSGVTLRAD